MMVLELMLLMMVMMGLELLLVEWSTMIWWRYRGLVAHVVLLSAEWLLWHHLLLWLHWCRLRGLGIVARGLIVCCRWRCRCRRHVNVVTNVKSLRSSIRLHSHSKIVAIAVIGIHTIVIKHWLLVRMPLLLEIAVRICLQLLVTTIAWFISIVNHIAVMIAAFIVTRLLWLLLLLFEHHLLTTLMLVIFLILVEVAAILLLVHLSVMLWLWSSLRTVAASGSIAYLLILELLLLRLLLTLGLKPSSPATPIVKLLGSSLVIMIRVAVLLLTPAASVAPRGISTITLAILVVVTLTVLGTSRSTLAVNFCALKLWILFGEPAVDLVAQVTIIGKFCHFRS